MWAWNSGSAVNRADCSSVRPSSDPTGSGSHTHNSRSRESSVLCSLMGPCMCMVLIHSRRLTQKHINVEGKTKNECEYILTSHLKLFVFYWNVSASHWEMPLATEVRIGRPPVTVLLAHLGLVPDLGTLEACLHVLSQLLLNNPFRN